MKKRRILTKLEEEEKKAFEEQVKALEERAERLRRMSFVVKTPENSDDHEGLPAYVRNNIIIEDATNFTVSDPAYNANRSLKLYFDLSETSTDEISDTILLLSELYNEIGGDKLIIKKSEMLEMIYELEIDLI